MSRRESYSSHWDGSKWSIVTSSLSFNQVENVNEPIRIATLNILADCFAWFVEMTIRSVERYEWLCNGIINLNPTILGLNEVTTNALQRLQESSFIRQNYFLTELLNENDDLLFPHGCIILSKFPLIEVFAISVTGRKREAIVGKVQLGNTIESCVYICAHHATPCQAVKNAQLRSEQINDIINVLEPLNHPFILMGDLNLYHLFEDKIIVEKKLIDGWAQTHFSNQHPFNDKDNGYTFDASKNTLIPYYIPGGSGQMRLDRILFSNGFTAFAIAPCRMWANEPIKSDNYLFPSDHFGLSIDLILRRTDNNNEQSQITMMSLSQPDPSAEQVLLHNSQNNDDQRQNRLGFIRKTKALTSHVVWLGAVALGLK
jgi:endonuclease/exonuclease/phosphatase family metal-dependent hydrolase